MELDSSKTEFAVRLADRDTKPSQTEPLERDQLVCANDLLILGEYALCSPLAWAAPERWWPAIANALSIVLTPLHRRDHRDCTAAIRSIFGDRLSASQPAALPRRQHALSLIEMMQHLRSHRPGGWTPRVEMVGTEHIDDALKAGTGAVLWITDLVFNTLVTKMALCRAGYRLTHLSRPSHPLSGTKFGRRILNPIVTRLETRYLARRVIVDDDQLAGGMRALIRALKANGVISITVCNGSRQTVQIPILNGYIHLAKGAPRLAAASGAPLLPVFTVRRDDGSFVTTIGAPLQFSRDGRPEDVAAEAMRRYVERLEPVLVGTPHLWYDWSGTITALPKL